MRYAKLILLLVCFCFPIAPTYGYYCALDCENLQVLQEEGMEHIQSVASISKVMTALIVLEHASIYEMVEIDKTMLNTQGSSIYLSEGELLSVEALLHGLLLRSGNDAALALALYCSNHNLEQFVEWMNDKAKRIGMLHTKFENPSGLDTPKGNQSNAYDMALLMCYASDKEDLLSIMRSSSYSTTNHETWHNKNRLLKMNKSVVAGKTGYTQKAGRTLLSLAASPNRIAIATFRISDDFNFHHKMYQELFEKHKMYQLFSKGIYQYHNKTFVVVNNGYVPATDFDINKITMKEKRNRIELYYDTLSWQFSYAR